MISLDHAPYTLEVDCRALSLNTPRLPRTVPRARFDRCNKPSQPPIRRMYRAGYKKAKIVAATIADNAYCHAGRYDKSDWKISITK
ncbi:hypothetical protein [Paraburkholderia sp. GAS334]|uniref:hypothetical protein n=1 Tax=Paraburkholderia sp. GAS334 TaxID=3035131 RepID=UPI003D1F5797